MNNHWLVSDTSALECLPVPTQECFKVMAPSP